MIGRMRTINYRKKELWHLGLSLAVIAISIYFSYSSENFRNYGYLGVFAISLISSATIFFPAPGWLTVIAMAKFLDPLLLGVVAGIGSGLGELTAYFAGDSVSQLLNDRAVELKKIEKTIAKYELFGIFFLAAIPNPLFDVAGIIAGSMKIPWQKFVVATIAGRIIRYVVLAFLGGAALSLLS